jgi:cytoskeletal protein CcmA (bactofilin family)
MSSARPPSSEILRARIASANGGGSHDEAPIEAPTASAAPLANDHISVIGADILITGNIEAEVDLHIEGRVVGDVRCATLILGERSSVTGNILAQRVRVSGAVEGSIETVDLAIEACATVRGDVTYSRLRVANGGVVSGRMEHVAIEGADHERPHRGGANDGGEDKRQPAKVHYIE